MKAWRSVAARCGRCCLAVLLVGCASSTPDAGARAARHDAQASARSVPRCACSWPAGYYAQASWTWRWQEELALLAGRCAAYGMRALIYQQMGELPGRENFLRARWRPQSRVGQ
jgi:Tfp pilus assembly protein PilF